jgi:hypothetical protein
MSGPTAGDVGTSGVCALCAASPEDYICQVVNYLCETKGGTTDFHIAIVSDLDQSVLVEKLPTWIKDPQSFVSNKDLTDHTVIFGHNSKIGFFRMINPTTIIPEKNLHYIMGIVIGSIGKGSVWFGSSQNTGQLERKYNIYSGQLIEPTAEEKAAKMSIHKPGEQNLPTLFQTLGKIKSIAHDGYIPPSLHATATAQKSNNKAKTAIIALAVLAAVAFLIIVGLWLWRLSKAEEEIGAEGSGESV